MVLREPAPPDGGRTARADGLLAAASLRGARAKRRRSARRARRARFATTPLRRLARHARRGARGRAAASTLATCGPGFLGALGHGDWVDRGALAAVRDDAGRHVAVTGGVGAGWAHSAAVVGDGVALAWGRVLEPPTSALRLSRLHGFLPPLARLVNATAKFLDRSGDLRLRPVPLVLPSPAVAVACGAGVTAVVLRDGSLRLLGANAFGQCGVGEFSEIVAVPAEVHFEGDSTAPAVTAAALGFRHGLALADDGAVYAWGKNDNGQLGDGTRDATPALRRVPRLPPCVQVACGLNFSAALARDGRLFVWGKMRDAHAAPAPNAVSHDLPPVPADALRPQAVAVPAGGDGRAPPPLVALACSSFHTAVLDASGGIHVAGLERGTRRVVHRPRPLRLPAGVGPARALRSGIGAVAVATDAAIYAPDLGPGLACGAELRLAANIDDVALGWKHVVAACAAGDCDDVGDSA